MMKLPRILLLLSLLPQQCLGLFGILEDYGLLDPNDILGSLFDLLFRKRRLQCAIKFLFMYLSAADKNFYIDKFRSDSIMELSESGQYIGPDNIAEYIGFAYDFSSLLVAEGPCTQSTQYRVIGYDDDSGQCELQRYQVDAYRLNQTLTENDTKMMVAVLNALYLDYRESYLTRVNIFYSKPFLDFYFGQQFNTQSIKDFICKDVLADACGDTAAPQCNTAIDALPIVTGDSYVDGNSLGCRVLHSAFAISNPSAHCPHVTLDTTDRDTSMEVKCSNSAGRLPTELFTEESIARFTEWTGDHDLDSEQGYAELTEMPDTCN